jgi:hypothetical protein
LFVKNNPQLVAIIWMNPKQPAIPIAEAPRSAAKYIVNVIGFACNPKGPIIGCNNSDVDTSVNALVNDMMPPAINPGIIKGTTILDKVVSFDAPRFCAASSKVVWTCWRTA